MDGKYGVINDEEEEMRVKLQWLEAVRKLLLSFVVIAKEKRGCHGEKEAQLGFFLWVWEWWVMV